ncbi:MAG TPA: hypothetical protein VKS60_11550, partial [Stellaceae bacterium]|nr:hypothetical protein [Stellaceae bacterium]
MKRSQDRILTTHVGSLIRPKPLIEQAQAARDDAGKRPDYERQLRAAVGEVVARQAAVGIDIVNDGEFGKSSWARYIMERVSGFELRDDQLREVAWLGRDRVRFAEFIAEDFPQVLTGLPTQACVGPITYTDHDSVRRDLDNLKAALRGADVEEAFFTAVAPASTAYDGVNEYYPTDRDYVFAVAEALREEYLEVHKAGFIVQVDDAVLANMYDELVQQSPHRYREWAQLRID